MLTTCNYTLLFFESKRWVNAPQTQEIISRTQMRPKGKNTSTGGDKRILTPLNQLQDMMYKTQQSSRLGSTMYKLYPCIFNPGMISPIKINVKLIHLIVRFPI